MIIEMNAPFLFVIGVRAGLAQIVKEQGITHVLGCPFVEPSEASDSTYVFETVEGVAECGGRQTSFPIHLLKG